MTIFSYMKTSIPNNNNNYEKKKKWTKNYEQENQHTHSL